ncbi:RNAse R [Arboricoccus pini]|uniref:Ribonuclease R n=2 Tax=Arboricoccus pini TaxID=1963835 RepID=A0A212Q7Y8_9PROT|nr:RNAse R [Arboricoccus pini]
MPSRDELLRVLSQAEERPRTNELLKAFGLKATARPLMKRMVRELESEGLIVSRRGRKPRDVALDGLPPVGVVDVTAIDENGDLVCQSAMAAAARILLPVEALDGKAPTVGDRLLVRLYPRGAERYDAHLMRLLPRLENEVVGVLEQSEDGVRLRPTDRNAKMEYRVGPEDLGGAGLGDMVKASVVQSPRPLALPRARVLERLGRADDPGIVSLAVATRLGLPMAFSAQALALAAAATQVELGKRTDYRNLDLVTIDGADARDFDDAVWAAADHAPSNPGGYRIVVAIADVAHYVRPGDPLDRDAHERGNSVYFPDRVIPMLPEELSNELCSLKPEVERACVVAEMRIDANGSLLDQRFRRGLMRSRARLTYERVQAARDGFPDDEIAPLLEPVIGPLYAAYEILAAARRKRGAIDLDLPERRVIFAEPGQMAEVTRRVRLDSHMLIEEFMILANVAAATVLEEANQPALYRVHDKPDPLKLETLSEFLERVGVPWTRGAKRPGDFTALLEKISEPAMRETVSGFILRSQAQAVYSPRNIGHFGLNLRRYAHFTSPIRRYSDLVVHRALIKVCRLGEGALPETDVEALAEEGAHLSRCERRAMEAERAALDRLVALYMADKEGSRFAAKITGCQRFGLFVVLDQIGAEGLVPVSSLGEDMFQFDERHHALVGRRWGKVFALGDRVEVVLALADTTTGALLFRIVEHKPGATAELARDTWSKGYSAGRGGACGRNRSGRPANIRMGRGKKSAPRRK